MERTNKKTSVNTSSKTQELPERNSGEECETACCTIDYGRLKEISEKLARSYAERPEQARKAVRVKARLIENYYKEATTESGFQLVADEAAERGGESKGPYPLEYFLAGFVFCELSIYTRAVALLEIPVRNLEISAEGRFDHRGNVGMQASDGFESIHYTVRFECPAEEEQIRSLVDFVDRSCPAYNTLRKGVKMVRQVIRNGRKMNC